MNSTTKKIYDTIKDKPARDIASLFDVSEGTLSKAFQRQVRDKHGLSLSFDKNSPLTKEAIQILAEYYSAKSEYAFSLYSEMGSYDTDPQNTPQPSGRLVERQEIERQADKDRETERQRQEAERQRQAAETERQRQRQELERQRQADKDRETERQRQEAERQRQAVETERQRQEAETERQSYKDKIAALESQIQNLLASDDRKEVIKLQRELFEAKKLCDNQGMKISRLNQDKSLLEENIDNLRAIQTEINKEKFEAYRTISELESKIAKLEMEIQRQVDAKEREVLSTLTDRLKDYKDSIETERRTERQAYEDKIMSLQRQIETINIETSHWREVEDRLKQKPLFQRIEAAVIPMVLIYLFQIHNTYRFVAEAENLGDSLWAAILHILFSTAIQAVALVISFNMEKRKSPIQFINAKGEKENLRDANGNLQYEEHYNTIPIFIAEFLLAIINLNVYKVLGNDGINWSLVMVAILPPLCAFFTAKVAMSILDKREKEIQ